MGGETRRRAVGGASTRVTRQTNRNGRSGAPRSGEPGTRKPRPGVWIPGSRASHAPRNDTTIIYDAVRLFDNELDEIAGLDFLIGIEAVQNLESLDLVVEKRHPR